MAKKGRPERDVEFTDTVPEKSAVQAILVKQDEILKALRAVRDEADLTAVQAALAALDLEDVELK